MSAKNDMATVLDIVGGLKDEITDLREEVAELKAANSNQDAPKAPESEAEKLVDTWEPCSDEEARYYASANQFH